MRSRLALTSVFVLAFLIVGCSSPIAPTPATQIQSPTQPPTSDPPESREPYALVAIERASVREYPPTPPGDDYRYDVRFLLRETGGRLGAQIETVSVTPANSRDLAFVGCWTVLPYIAAGGTFDVFYTDEGMTSLGYCGPEISSKTPIDAVRIVVGFEDADNREGTVEAVIAVRSALP